MHPRHEMHSLALCAMFDCLNKTPTTNSQPRCRITEQIDHHSLFVVMWVLGWPLSEFFDLITR